MELIMCSCMSLELISTNGNKKNLFLAIFDLRLSIVKSGFRLPPIRCVYLYAYGDAAQ